MKRRKALELTAGLLGGTIIGAEFFISGCSKRQNLTIKISEDQVAFLNEVGEAILPHSDRSPGAKETNIGGFMRAIVMDCYEKKEAEIFVSGIEKIDRQSKAQFQKGFMELSLKDRQTLLIEFDKEAGNLAENEGPHFFTMMKQLTIWGYFTSEPGATKALRYNPIPGRYEGCVEYTPGDKAWA